MTEDDSPSLSEIVDESGDTELVSCGICGKTIRRNQKSRKATFDRLPEHWANPEMKCPGSEMKRKVAIDIFYLIEQRIEGEND